MSRVRPISPPSPRSDRTRFSHRALMLVGVALLAMGCAIKEDRWDLTASCTCTQVDGGFASFGFLAGSTCSEQRPTCSNPDCSGYLRDAGCAEAVVSGCDAEDTEDFCN